MIAPRRICVVTAHGELEPRGPRHAIAAKRAFPDADVEFVHHQPYPPSAKYLDVPLLREREIRVSALTYPVRTLTPVTWAMGKARTRLSRAAFRGTGTISQGVYGERCQTLTSALLARPADLYFAHCIETLLPAVRAAQCHGAALMFDCMEFYAAMGSDGPPVEISPATRTLEARWLPRCKLVTASSDAMADALVAEYGIARPLATYNATWRLGELPPRKGGGLNLYWRNSVISFGPRGLEDALLALTRLPVDVRLFVQGQLPTDGGKGVRGRIAELGLTERVTILPPHPAGEGALHAAQFEVGLCLERRSNRNYELTVSNKLFDYMMGGLAVVSADLPGLASVVEKSASGLLFEPGNVDSLVACLQRLLDDKDLLARLQLNGRKFAMHEGNLEFELDRVTDAMLRAMAA